MSVLGSGTLVSPGVALFAPASSSSGETVSSPLSIAPTTPVNSVSINSTLTSGGTTNIGSSVAHPNTISLLENTGVGAGFVAIKGDSDPGSASLNIVGGFGGSQGCSMATSGSSGASLAIGANATSYNNIVLQQNKNTFSVPPSFAYSTTSQNIGSVPNASSIALTNPANPGLYAICIGTNDSSLGTYSADSQLGIIGYWNGTTWNVGGSGVAFTSSGGGALGVRPDPSGGTYKQRLLLYNQLGADTTANTVVCYMVPLSASLTGLI